GGGDRARPAFHQVAADVERGNGLRDVHVEHRRARDILLRRQRRRAGAEQVERYAGRIVVVRVRVDVHAAHDAIGGRIDNGVDRVVEARDVDVAAAALLERRIAVLHVGIPGPAVAELAFEAGDVTM